MKICNLATTAQREVKSSQSGQAFSLSKSLNDAFDIETLLVHEETLLTGRASSSPHHHTEKDEIFLVVSGHPTLVVNGEKTLLGPGDYVGFPGSSTDSRALINESSEKAVILTIGTNPPGDKVVYDHK